MIKMYNRYIKELMDNHIDIDPYGEEEWEEDSIVLQIAKKQNKPYDQITILDCTRKDLTNLDGIEELVNLKSLYCSYNRLTNLNGIENLINLEYLYCFLNRLNTLDIENLANLRVLNCSYNSLTSLDGIEKLDKIERIDCNYNLFPEEYKKYLRGYRKKKKIRLYM